MKQKSKLTQWTVTSFLFAWGMISFMFLAGDDPMNPLQLSELFLIKGLAAASITALYFIARYCNRKGWLPEVKEEDDLC